MSTMRRPRKHVFIAEKQLLIYIISIYSRQKRHTGHAHDVKHFSHIIKNRLPYDTQGTHRRNHLFI